MNKRTHQTCIELIEAMDHFKRMVQLTNDSIEGFPGSFPELKRKYNHKLEIYRACINRLEDRYHKQLKTLMK